jgi:ADP-heptose:LPS heptosyltransferase
VNNNTITDPNLNNIPHVIQMTLQVRKPIKLAVMANGLGDICMSLGSAHALFDLGYRVTVTAQERFHEFIKMCPQIYSVTEKDREGEIWICAWHQLQKRHQVDEVIAACGIDLSTVSNGSKSMDLVLPQEAKDAMAARFPGNNRIAIHNAGSIPAKRWPIEYWQELVNRFRADGIEVLSTGVRAPLIGTGHEVFLLDGVTEAFDIPRAESIALFNQCKVLISGDSGPVQLAGTTEVGIVGLFSIVKPETRLPYRHGELGWNAVGISSPCPEIGCYHKMVYDTPYQWVPELMEPIMADPNCMSDLMYNWCLNEDKFSCMKVITVDEVYTKTMELFNKQETR